MVESTDDLILPLAVVSSGEVSAALTLPSHRVAVVTVAVTMTRSALGEAPEAWLALRTLAPRGPWDTHTLARDITTEGTD